MEYHQTWFKIMFNPILRKLGWCIVSVIDTDTESVIGYELRKYPENCKV